MKLADQLAAAQAEVARLEREMAGRKCSEVGHRWVHMGGANCGCYEDASCSVPAYECSVCKDCDYGQNAEAKRQRKHCRDNPACEISGVCFPSRNAVGISNCQACGAELHQRGFHWLRWDDPALKEAST